MQRRGPTAPAMRRFSYRDVTEGHTPAIWEWMAALVHDGATLLDGVPRAHAEWAVERVASLIGPLQPQIYGNTFEVRSEEGAINLAYTDQAIDPHMDLCYYESPPGVQLLHCIQFDEDVLGGESFLIDAFEVGERVREKHPVAFQSLARLPATFIKDHAKRERPVLMSYQRPHFSVDAEGRLTGVFWSPPFEGPLHLPLDNIPEYYAAVLTSLFERLRPVPLQL